MPSRWAFKRRSLVRSVPYQLLDLGWDRPDIEAIMTADIAWIPIRGQSPLFAGAVR